MVVSSDLGIVDTKYFRLDEGLVLDSGVHFGPITLAYEMYGKLNSDKSNAILVTHAFSGDAHAAGMYEGDKKPGWWDNMIGPGKALDTDKFCVISSNVIGGCQGSTGPSIINPKTGKPYGLDFPFITVSDMVKAQKKLIDYLGIEKLVTVVGGSLGGMQVLEWVASYPDSVLSAIPIATTLRHSPQQIAFNEVGRQSIIADSDWNNGDYYDKKRPEVGFAIARMIGHITYMSDISMEKKFSRRIRETEDDFKGKFEVESYLHYQGDSFVKRFDANSYLYITKAMDYFDVTDKLIGDKKDLKVKFLVIAFESDWLYPAYQSLNIVKQLRTRHVPVTYCVITSTYGHDAFLLEKEEETKLIKPFVNAVR